MAEMANEITGNAAVANAQDAGMADEISRILGKFTHYKEPEDPIMKRRKSKFVEAVEADKERQRNLALKVQKKRQQRNKDLHIPETSLDTKERTLRKIATKGVVMLFNAISTHQKKLVDDEIKAEAKEQAAKEKRLEENAKRDREAAGTNGKKRNFMDALKEKRAALKKNQGTRTDGETSEKRTRKEQDSAATTKGDNSTGSWKVLKDDLLMGSTLKDWDKGSDSDSDHEGALSSDVE